MTKLVKDAVGFDAARGDSVSVVNVGFKPEVLPEEIKADEIPIWERPLMRDIAKLVAALIVLLTLVLSVLRPLVRGLLAAPRPVFTPSVSANVVTPALRRRKARPRQPWTTTRRLRRRAAWYRRIPRE